jgi:hypothetical protein
MATEISNAYALVIGIANYKNVNELPSSILQDAKDIRKILIDPFCCGYSSGNVQLLLDSQATKTAICQELTYLAERTDADSTVLLYVSGHGGRIESGRFAGQYLLPVDVQRQPDEMLATSAISDREFTAALKSLPARKVVVIFDCCHAGGIGEPKDPTAQVFKAGFSEEYYDALKQGRGRAILASSRSDEYSWVKHGAKYSVFTQHLLAGLSGGIASDDGLIHIFELFEYIQPKVTSEQPNQHPIFKAELEENFPVALYLGGHKSVIPRDEDGFRYDAYISYVDKDPDTTWVWQSLVPRLEQAGLRIAVSGDVEEPGVYRVVGIERGIRQSKRTIVVLSETYLDDNMADFENIIGQTMSIQEGTYRLLPVRFFEIDDRMLPTRLSALTTLNLAHPQRSEREYARLIRALQGPLPQRLIR